MFRKTNISTPLRYVSFRKILRTYLMDGPFDHIELSTINWSVYKRGHIIFRLLDIWLNWLFYMVSNRSSHQSCSIKKEDMPESLF